MAPTVSDYVLRFHNKLSELDAIEDLRLEDAHKEVTTFLLGELPKLVSSKVEIKDIPVAISAPNLIEFSDALLAFSPEFTQLIALSNSFDAEDMPWYPLYDALRLYFTVERIGQIQSQNEYHYALSGIHHIESEFFDYMEEIDLQVFIPQAEALVASKFSGEKDCDDLLAMIARFDGSAYIYTPPEIVFEGPSGGLEAPFTEWLNAFMVTPLFDDEFDGDGSSLEFNLQSLIERWNRRPLQERSPYGDKIWHIIAINTPVQFNYEEKLITFEIHKISQLADPDIGLDPAIPTNPEIHYKITLFRTGERHQYDADMDRSLLAVQVIIASENLKCPVKEIEADIDWLRLDERDYPLVGLSEEELHSISHQYLMAQ